MYAIRVFALIKLSNEIQMKINLMKYPVNWPIRCPYVLVVNKQVSTNKTRFKLLRGDLNRASSG